MALHENIIALSKVNVDLIDRCLDKLQCMEQLTHAMYHTISESDSFASELVRLDTDVKYWTEVNEYDIHSSILYRIRGLLHTNPSLGNLLMVDYRMVLAKYTPIS